MTERIWDRFLTEADKTVLAAGRGERVGFGARPALLLVDLYRAAFGDKPEPLLDAIRTWPASCGPNGWAALPHIKRLLLAARTAGLPVVHVTMRDDSDGLRGWHEAAHAGVAYGQPEPSQEMRERSARKTEIVPDVAPIAGEPVILKSSPSPFWGTPLIGHLINLGVDTLIVAGERTSGCVRATVVDAVANRFRVIVPEECVFDAFEAAHALNLFDIHHKYGDVLPLGDVLRHVQPASGRPVDTAAE
jgi:maleamate amidohydrolase